MTLRIGYLFLTAATEEIIMENFDEYKFGGIDFSYILFLPKTTGPNLGSFALCNN